MSPSLSFEAIFGKMHIFCTVACFCCHQGIETNGVQWSALFEPYIFFESYKNYLQVDIRAEDDEDLRLWKGWVESRLRQLTLKVNINALFHQILKKCFTMFLQLFIFFYHTKFPLFIVLIILLFSFTHSKECSTMFT